MRNTAGTEGNAQAGPEGPYEADASVAPARVHDLRYTEDALRMLDFVNKFRNESSRMSVVR